MTKVIDNTNLGYLKSKMDETYWNKEDVIQVGIDTVPTANSNNLITSGAVKSALEVIVANGYEYVDFDLPSGTLWATCNVGATNPEDAGNYYSYADPTPRTNQGNQYLSSGTYTKYNLTDGKTVIEDEDDAAHVTMGGGWRIPTKEQWEELKTYTNIAHETLNGIIGNRLTSKSDSNKSIFIPEWGTAASSSTMKNDEGYYATSTLYVSGSDISKYYDVYIESPSFAPGSTIDRKIGTSVRAVLLPSSIKDVILEGSGGSGGGVSNVTLGGVSVVSNGTAVLPAYPTTLPASDVSAWAKASTKPTYTFSEIGSTPTTLSGYGITDAKIDNGIITLGANTITPITSYTDEKVATSPVWPNYDTDLYPVLGHSGSAETKYTNSSFRFQYLNNGSKPATLWVGQPVNDQNEGILRLYGTKSHYCDIHGGSVTTDNTITFPDASGTVALTTDIPAAITESTVSGWGFTKNAGTVTGVKMNGTTNNPTSGVVDLGTVLTSETALSKGTTSGSGNAVTDVSVSGHTVTLTKGSTVPVATSANAGKIPRITSAGAWEYITPAQIYSGSATPSNSTGNNGDVYVQS